MFVEQKEVDAISSRGFDMSWVKLLLPSFFCFLSDFSLLQLCALLVVICLKVLAQVISVCAQTKCIFWDFFYNINVDVAFMRSPVWLMNLCRSEGKDEKGDFG